MNVERAERLLDACNRFSTQGAVEWPRRWREGGRGRWRAAASLARPVVAQRPHDGGAQLSRGGVLPQGEAAPGDVMAELLRLGAPEAERFLQAYI